MTAADASASSSDPLSAGRAALRRRDWVTARRHFQAALDVGQTPEALEGLAEAAWYEGDEAQLFDARERAYRLHLERGDRAGAARMALALANDSVEFRGQPAVANGWIERARRLLEGLDPTAEHAWLAVWEAHRALMLVNDAAAARVHASRGATIAQTLGITDAVMLSRAIEGLALVCAGDIEGGLRRLDESATASLAGEVSDLNAAGTILCYLVDACDRLRDFDRASQWCERVREWADRVGWGDAFSVCRPHYAVVLMWRGAWDEAERQLAMARTELSAARPPMAVEAVVRLAELRWRQGRWDEAAALFREVEHEGLSQLGRAELALSRGNATEALDLADRYLRRIPAEDRVERAQGLELKVRALVRLGDAERAAGIAAELRQIAAAVNTEPLRAAACLAEGLVAACRGDHEAALPLFEDAIDFYGRSGGVFEEARSRLQLARTLLALGRADAAAREAGEGLSSFRRLGAQREAPVAEGLMREISRSTSATSAAEPRAEGPALTSRERQVLALIAAGRSNSEIAEALVLSVRTVERHISNIYGKMGVSGKVARAAAAAFAIRRGVVSE